MAGRHPAPWDRWTAEPAGDRATDAAYHLADDPSAGDTWDEAARELLAELGHALSDALDLLRVREE